MRILLGMRAVDLIGWAASCVLVVTIAKQVWKQWTSGTSEGVSGWLFVGQTAASAGFTVYSVLIGSRVFAVTNSLMLLNALAGLAIVRRHRRRVPRRLEAVPRRRTAPQVRETEPRLPAIPP